jgi:hypothetical protein
VELPSEWIDKKANFRNRQNAGVASNAEAIKNESFQFGTSRAFDTVVADMRFH